MLFDEEQLKEIGILAATKSHRDIAKHFNISLGKFNTIMKNQPEVRNVIKEGRKHSVKNGIQGENAPDKTIVLTDDQIAKVGVLAECLNLKQIADYLGIAELTFINIRKRQSEVDEAYKRGRAMAIGDIGGNLVMKAKGGDTSSQIFYLKTQAGWKDCSNEVNNKPEETKPITIINKLYKSED